MLKPNGKLFITTPNEPDSAGVENQYKTGGGHIGIMNNEEIKSFINNYKNMIISEGFYDNLKLFSCDYSEFIINESLENYSIKDGYHRSHFKITIGKQ
jgi:hypothetical protein